MKSILDNLIKKTQTKIFCLSMQRTGTTSVGQFFKEHGYKVADWSISNRNKWSYYWDSGDYEAIFRSKDFKNNQVFEDDPWWLPEFYKVLYHRFPGAKFILFVRDEDDWFKSMLKHSNGKTLGNTMRHCKVYRREDEFYDMVSEKDLKLYDKNKIDNLMDLKGYDEHYKSIYRIRNKEIINFFRDYSKDSLFVCELENPLKWRGLAEFIGLEISLDYNVHVNKSKDD